MSKKSSVASVSGGIWKTYANVLKKYFSFKGRASRYELSAFLVVNFIILFLLEFAQRQTGFAMTFMVIGGIYKIAVLLPFLGLLVRRMHDIGKNNWWAGILIFLMFVPVILGVVLQYPVGVLLSFVAYIVSIFFFFRKSQAEANAYGEPDTAVRGRFSKVATFMGWLIYILPLLTGLFIVAMSVNRYQQESAVYQMQEDIARIQDFSQDKKDYSLINASYLLENKLLPSQKAEKCTAEEEKTCLQNEFGGGLIISGNPYSKYKNMIYILNDLSSQECMFLATREWGPRYLGALISSQELGVEDFSPEKTSATMDCRCSEDTCSIGLVFN